MGSQPSRLEKCLQLLRGGAPTFPVRNERDNAARADIIGAKTVSFAYLYPGPGLWFTLDLYPGDPLEQARALYGDSLRLERLLSLRGRGGMSNRTSTSAS